MCPLVPILIDCVYKKQFKFDITKKLFLTKNEGFEGEIAKSLDELTLDHPQIKFREDLLGKYLIHILEDPYDDCFLKYLDWLAKTLTDTSDKKSTIHVDYIYLNALMGFVDSAIINAVRTLRLERNKEGDVLIAFNNRMRIQNDYYAKYYMNPYFINFMEKEV
ncbi:Protoglobin-domain-containing protein [Parasitella parasitica]|nr:Protoglobin-domain-containing protein [Parasitella parasitica]